MSKYGCPFIVIVSNAKMVSEAVSSFNLNPSNSTDISRVEHLLSCHVLMSKYDGRVEYQKLLHFPMVT
jgi:hypothetical protein